MSKKQRKKKKDLQRFKKAVRKHNRNVDGPKLANALRIFIGKDMVTYE